MRRSMWAIIAAVVVVGAGVGIWLGVSHNNNNSSPTMNMNSQTNTNNAAPVATDKVSIQNFAFSPASITVKKGTTVTWTNSDSVTHTVTEKDAQTGPNSGDLAPGESYSFTFNKVGTYHYHCTIHTEMLGTVTVTN
ncbi:MAG TPA: cupredoxin family copper-binding protein [Candidatus Saccharimonadales bacterium]|nr:cupredoxin family copper-binding protein [Candidatus Saccharimonadales bacterium]